MKALLLVIAAICTFAPPQETAKQREARFDAVSKTLGSTYDECWRVAGRIRPGATSDEKAYILARAYFYAFVNGCGAVGYPSDGGKVWVFKCVEGAAPRPGHKIFVEKATGTTWAEETSKMVAGKAAYNAPPRIKDPRVYLKHASASGL